MTLTHEQKLSAVVKAVQEAVPEIMELKFGCNLARELHGKSFYMTYIGQNNGQHALLLKDNEMLFVDRIEKEVIVLGRPITLEDILRTYQHHFNVFANMEVIDQVKIAKEGFKDIAGWWQLGVPLHNQSERCISHLYSAICEKV